jgi:carbamoyltransferase
MNILGIFHSYSDPSAALVRDGKVIAFVEEERLLRVKHACGYFPSRAIEYVLKASGLSITDIDCIAQAWNCEAYDSGEMAGHYQRINTNYPTTAEDIAYQQKHLGQLNSETQRRIVLQNLRNQFGDHQFPPIVFVQHHFAHACMAYFHSGMKDALVLTIDGSGEWITTAVWAGRAGKLELLHEVDIPHSLGWFYAAFTEYLGFQAYDGEYKVMGLAAYGRDNLELKEKVGKLIWYDGQGGFESDPTLLSRGKRSYSYYYPDALVKHMGRSPRAANEGISQWHIDLAYEVQKKLETIVEEIVRHWVGQTGMRNLAIAGGVGLNVKMNGSLFTSGLIDDIFVHPLCADAGVPIGAALALEYRKGKLESHRLEDVYFGPSYGDEEIEKVLAACKLDYTKEESIEEKVAELLARGAIVGWFQGKMEGGPRALGARSILADPRHVEARDRVNAVIKYREFWRPFCPSLNPDGAAKYLVKHTFSPFMILAFQANERARQEVPAVIHVDSSSRPQIVDVDSNPRYFRLIQEFGKLTGVQCVLNTSFNIKGEPIVCSPHDAIRTFAATGLDALAIGPFLLEKPNSQVKILSSQAEAEDGN